MAPSLSRRDSTRVRPRPLPPTGTACAARVPEGMHEPKGEFRTDAWRASAPPGFLYALKFSRYGTHMKKLKEPAESIGRFLERAERLEEHLGPILVQLPPRWRADPDRLGAFLEPSPRGHGRLGLPPLPRPRRRRREPPPGTFGRRAAHRTAPVGRGRRPRLLQQRRRQPRRPKVRNARDLRRYLNRDQGAAAADRRPRLARRDRGTRYTEHARSTRSASRTARPAARARLTHDRSAVSRAVDRAIHRSSRRHERRAPPASCLLSREDLFGIRTSRGARKSNSTKRDTRTGRTDRWPFSETSSRV